MSPLEPLVDAFASDLIATAPAVLVAAPPSFTGSLGSRLFESRRWVHPPFLLAALLLGGATDRGTVLGGVLVALYITIRLWACRSIRGAARVHARKAQERKVLVTGGPFGWVRNPLYLGNTAGLAGTCLLLGPPWLAALAAATSLLWYHFVVRWEESILAGLYPADYPAYCAAVPRFIPRLRRRVRPPETDTRDAYPWSKVLRRERGAIVIAVGIVLLAVWRRQSGW